MMMMLEALVYQGNKKYRTESYNDNEDEYCVDYGKLTMIGFHKMCFKLWSICQNESQNQ